MVSHRCTEHGEGYSKFGRRGRGVESIHGEHVRDFQEKIKYLINNYIETSKLKKCNIFQLLYLSFGILKASS